MGIQVSNPSITPGLVYDKVHALKLDIQQELRDYDYDTPKYQVHLMYRMYAVNLSDSKIFYHHDLHIIRLPDYLEQAVLKQMEGNPDLVIALSAIEDALITIIQDQGTHGTAMRTS